MKNKECPVERGKLLIGLEVCREMDPDRCADCPYYESRNYCGGVMAGDALSYIGWLEEQNEQLKEMLSNAVDIAERAMCESTCLRRIIEEARTIAREGLGDCVE